MALNSKVLQVQRPDEIALRDRSVALRWSELDDVANRCANGLNEILRSPSRRVAVLAENSAEVVLANVGALHAPASLVPVNYHLTVDEVAYILQDSTTQVLFVGPESAGVGRAAAARVGGITVIGWRCPPGTVDVAWEEWIGRSSPSEPALDALAVPNMMYTSGTTGVAKGVELPPVQYPPGMTVAELVEYMSKFRFFMQDSTHLVAGPLYHTGPAIASRVLTVGKPVVVLERFDPESVLRLIDGHRVETTMMVPTHFQRLLALPDRVKERYDTSSLRLVVHTGAACPPHVKRAMIEWWGPVLMEAYGGTEVGSVCKIDSSEWLARPGSVGQVQPPFVRAVIVDDEGREVPANTEGRLYFEDSTGRGIVYSNDPEKTASAHLRPGVFTLGDIGYVDDEGYVFITDRFSDMIVSGGVNVYPAEAERVLLEHPAVADAAVIGIPDADLGEVARALVVPNDPGRPPSSDELIQLCRGRLAAYKCPRSVELVQTLGRNAVGKLNKQALRAPYWHTARTIGG